jgi:hypothetical protein
VQVKGPFKPPAKKAKPKPQPCYTVTVSPKTLSVGKWSALNVLVTAAKKPVKGTRVKLQGPGILKLSNKTDRKGHVSVRVHPQKPGILKVRTVGHKGCTVPRVGIVGPFTPPVTG